MSLALQKWGDGSSSVVKVNTFHDRGDEETRSPEAGRGRLWLYTQTPLASYKSKKMHPRGSPSSGWEKVEHRGGGGEKGDVRSTRWCSDRHRWQTETTRGGWGGGGPAECLRRRSCLSFCFSPESCNRRTQTFTK